MSQQKFSKVAVMGLGKVGSLVATLLQESGFDVTGIDAVAKKDLPFTTKVVDVSSESAVKAALQGQQAVVSCLPYHLNIALSRLAAGMGIHYFDLTEDVPTTKAILELSKTAKVVLAPQCGLAPGFIGIIGAHLAKDFEKIRHIKLRVGALPQHPTGLLGYAFNWSPEGVVNEYLNDCEVIENGQQKLVSPMEWLETLYIDGLQLEAFTTSGGLGTMCETYLGRAENLDYKTMRYPGHAQLMNFFFHELLMREDRTLAGKILTHAKPPVDEDVVYVHASVEGVRGGQNSRAEFVRAYRPQVAGGKQWRAISWTTAASVCAVVEMVAKGHLPDHGFIRQEDISLDKFLATKNGHLYITGDPKKADGTKSRAA